MGIIENNAFRIKFC